MANIYPYLTFWKRQKVLFRYKQAFRHSDPFRFSHVLLIKCPEDIIGVCGLIHQNVTISTLFVLQFSFSDK